MIREGSYLLLVKSFWYLMNDYPNSRDVNSDFRIAMKNSFVNTIPISRPSSDIAKVFLRVALAPLLFLQTQVKILADKAVNSSEHLWDIKLYQAKYWQHLNFTIDNSLEYFLPASDISRDIAIELCVQWSRVYCPRWEFQLNSYSHSICITWRKMFRFLICVIFKK